MTTTTRILTAQDLWNMPGNGTGYELVRGELQPMPPSGQEHSSIGVGLAAELHTFVKRNKLGTVTGADAGYLIRQNPDTVRAPDIAFVQASRLLGEKPTKGYFRGPPDLAVEIISPNDAYQDVDDKVKEFLDAGTRLVWVVNPRHRTVKVHRADNTITPLNSTDQLSGEDVLPGFSLPVADIFI